MGCFYFRISHGAGSCYGLFRMDYEAQAAFLRRYRAWATLAAVFILAGGMFLLLALPGDSAERTLFAAVTLATAASMFYTPKYLRWRTDFARRSVSWQVRVRWIMLIAAVAIGAAILRDRNVRVLALIVIWAALWNLAAGIGMRNRTRWSWILYLASDILLLAYLAMIQSSPVLLTAIAALSGHLLLLTAPERNLDSAAVIALQSVLLLFAFRTGIFPLLPWLLLILLATYFLSRMARQQHEATHQAVTVELAAMLGKTDDEMRELIVTGNRTMVERWKLEKPDTSNPEALARWYSETSYWYLGAHAEFHLTYKHILFMLDVLRLARGRCLDFGAGNGDLSLALARGGHETVHFDVPGSSLDFARWRAQRRQLPLCFLTQRAELKPFIGGFDTIVSLDVLEHIPDLAAVLDLFSSLLAPGGRLIINIPFGATAAHPMHLDHPKVDVPCALRRLGLEDIKSPALKLRGSELLRKRDVLLYEKPPRPPAIATSSTRTGEYTSSIRSQ